MKETLANLIHSFVLPNVKAAVAFVVSAFVTYLAQQGVVVDGDAASSLVVGLSGLVVALCVWLFPNKK